MLVEGAVACGEEWEGQGYTRNGRENLAAHGTHERLVNCCGQDWPSRFGIVNRFALPSQGSSTLWFVAIAISRFLGFEKVSNSCYRRGNKSEDRRLKLVERKKKQFTKKIQF